VERVRRPILESAVQPDFAKVGLRLKTLAVETFARDSKGAVWLNKPLPNVKGGILAPLTEPPSAALPAAGSISAPIRFESATDAYSEITDLIGVRGANDDTEETLFSSLVQYTSGSERKLQNRPILASHMFGTAQQPFLLSLLSETLFLKPQECINLVLKNASAATVSNFSTVMKIVKAQIKATQDAELSTWIKHKIARGAVLHPYWFTMHSSVGGNAGVTLATGGQATVVFNNKINSTLIILASMASAFSSGIAGDTQEKFKGRLVNERNQQQLDNQFVTWNCGWGSGALPFILPTPLFVYNRQSLTLQLQNLVTDQPTNVYVTYFGVALQD
jgi:hypothetical protein